RSLAAGVRRMEALTGRGAIDYFRERETAAQEQQRQFQEKQKQLEKELKQLRVKLASVGAGFSRPEDDNGTIEVNGVKLLTRRAARGVGRVMLDLEGELDAVIAGLERTGVEYAVCGGLAMAIHGKPRATIDIDLLIQSGDEERVYGAVEPLGFRIKAKPMDFA